MSIFKDSLRTITLSLIILSLISIAYAWTEPTVTPPGGNTSAPVNVSDTSQIKTGSLEVNGFWNRGTTILDGNVGIGITSEIYEKSGTTCNAGDTPIAYKITEKTCNGDIYPDCTGGTSCSVGQDWLPTMGETTCKYEEERSSCSSTSTKPCSTASTFVRCQTNIGSGLTIGGVSGTDGIKFPDGTVQTTAAGGSNFGDWVTLVNSDFQQSKEISGAASSNGFIVAYVSCDMSNPCAGNIIGYLANEIIAMESIRTYAGGYWQYTPYGSITFPVKKDATYKISAYQSEGNKWFTLKVFFIPLQ